MPIDVVEVKVVKGCVLFLRFENGVEGELDIPQLIPFKGVFSKLKNLEYFSTVSVHPELGTIVWENGADLSPTYLYLLISKTAA